MKRNREKFIVEAFDGCNVKIENFCWRISSLDVSMSEGKVSGRIELVLSDARRGMRIRPLDFDMGMVKSLRLSRLNRFGERVGSFNLCVDGQLRRNKNFYSYDGDSRLYEFSDLTPFGFSLWGE